MSYLYWRKGHSLSQSNRKIDGRVRRAAQLETLERRVFLSASAPASAYESIDGTENNLAHNTWGAAGTDLIRLAAAKYADGISSPNLPGDLSARAISNLVNSQADPANPGQDLNTLDQNNLSDYGYAFGQFIDHDMDLTPDGGASLPISVAANDAIGPDALPFTRSQYDASTGTSTSNPRQQVTDITAYLDLSQVYGSDAATAADLRTMRGGLMKTSPGNLLPYDNSTYFTPSQLASLNAVEGGMANSSGVPTASLFAAGDIRADENLELTALETLFVRNHNFIAGKLQKQHPGWTDEQLYQEARKINIAGYQAIIYNEWLPAVYGSTALPRYTGYKPNVNASIANEFSTVAFRFGHSMVSPTIARQGNDGLDVLPEVPLAFDFFDPYLLNASGAIDPYTGLASSDIGAVLKASADGNGQAMDVMAVNDIRNLLFSNFGLPGGGEDLIARDVQRDRDNGIPDYNSLRVTLGFKPVTSFAQITSNVAVQKELAAAYPGGVNTIDAFEGGLAEDHVPGSDVGPLFQAIMVNQFVRLRDGDRFFYLNENLNPEEMNLFQQSNSLTKVIEANTNITNLQADVMIFTASIGGTVTQPPPPGARPGTPPPPGLPGITVQLLDSSEDVLATTTTDKAGHYCFNQQTGIDGTGNYAVSVVLPAGGKLATRSPGTILVSRGDLNVTGVDFGIALSSATQPPAGSKPAAPPPQPTRLPPPLPPGWSPSGAAQPVNLGSASSGGVYQMTFGPTSGNCQNPANGGQGTGASSSDMIIQTGIKPGGY